MYGQNHVLILINEHNRHWVLYCHWKTYESIIKDTTSSNYPSTPNDSGRCVVSVCLYNATLFHKKSCIR